MKTKLLLPLLAVIAIIMNSCSSGESADAGDLIATVPNDASLVAVANLKAIVEKADAKNLGTNPQELADILCNPENGVEPSVAVVFNVGYYTYVSGIAADPAKFKAAIEKKKGVKFTTEDGIDVGGNFAVSANQYWMCIGNTSIDPCEVKHFTSLDKTQSFTSNKQSDALCKFDKDIVGWGNIAGLLNTANADFQQRAIVQAVLQTAFEDASDLSFSVDFQKGKAVIEANILNTKGSLAKFLFPTETIDVKTVESAGTTTDALAAIAIPNKLITELIKQTSSKGVSMFDIILKSFSGVDGTTAVAFNENGSALSGVISTNGQNMAAITQLLAQRNVKTVLDGNKIRISEGTLSGNSQVSELAAEFKGAMLGVATASARDFIKGSNQAVAGGAFTLRPSGNSLQARVVLFGTDRDKNILSGLVKAAAVQSAAPAPADTVR